MKGLWKEFKAFIFRGNVVDMAIGVIVASSFTAIVNGLSNFVLKPLINWVLASLLGADSLSEVFTVLKGVYVDVLDDTGAVIGKTLDLTQSIYIDWGSFINAIINFLMVALTLFIILKTFTSIKKRMNIKAGIQAKLDADEELNDIEKRILRKWEKRDPATAPKKVVPAPAAPAAPTEAELLTKLCALMEENIELQKTNKQ
ncbi:MAG: large conductance mechanosensitive channel protein MscL [Clostridia bacterium]|nr:large conductance mechanosensitive channel protein MscL [Clostridia bacterium]